MARKIHPEVFTRILIDAYGVETPTLNRLFKRVLVPKYVKLRIVTSNRKIGRR